MRPFLASSSKARKRLASMTAHKSLPLRDSAAPLTRLALSLDHAHCHPSQGFARASPGHIPPRLRRGFAKQK